MPTSQAAPNITALNAVTALSNPNGLLIQYDVWDRGGHLSWGNPTLWKCLISDYYVYPTPNLL